MVEELPWPTWHAWSSPTCQSYVYRRRAVTMGHRFTLRIVAVSVFVLLAAGPALGDVTASKKREENPKVVFSTTLGRLTIELYPEKAPVTVKNFLAYVDAGFYDGTVFHRVVPGFVIQGGGFDEKMTKKSTRPAIKNEADNGLKNKRGTLSMARTRDVDSATSQFFINLKNNKILDHGVRDFGYAVFGKVIQGMQVVDKIATVPTTSLGMFQGVPVEAVVIKSARRK